MLRAPSVSEYRAAWPVLHPCRAPSPAVDYTSKAEREIVMNRLCICIVLFGFAVTTSRAEQTNTPDAASVSSNALAGVTSNTPPSSITIDGTTYQDFRWARVTPATVTIFHKTGVAAIPLERLPRELQVKFGYDPVKAQQYRLLEAQASVAREQARRDRLQRLQQQQAEEDRLNQLKATAVDFHCRIVAVDSKGMIVRTRVDGIPILSPPGVLAAELPDMPAMQSQIVHAYLVGHPDQASLAVGSTITCRAYRDGQQETDGEPLPRWVYAGDALHPILPPPPP